MAAAGASEPPVKPPKIQLLLAHATDCMSKYDLEGAIKFYEKAVSICPDDTDLLDAAGELCVELGRTEDAVKLLRRSIELRPEDNAAKYMNLGQLMAGEDSLNLFQKGIELMQLELAGASSEDPDAANKLKLRLCSGFCSMTEIYMTDLCDHDGAEQRCEEFLLSAQSFAPNSVELYVQWANLRLCQCRPDDAKKMAYKALSTSNGLDEADKPSLEVRTNIMKLLIELEQVDEAEELGRSLLEVDDEYVETW
jgi:tetratricopeptide (TPR) repeat protein